MSKTKTKNKPHKGLLKRVRVTKSGKIKFQRACGRHLRSHKSASATRGYRLPAFAHAADSPRLRGLLCLPGKRKRSAPANPVTSAETSNQTEKKDS